jgi:hypothetical protein
MSGGLRIMGDWKDWKRPALLACAYVAAMAYSLFLAGAS